VARLVVKLDILVPKVRYFRTERRGAEDKVWLLSAPAGSHTDCHALPRPLPPPLPPAPAPPPLGGDPWLEV
jgi:hypothetical protein